METPARERLCVAIVAKPNSADAQTPLLSSLFSLQYALTEMNVDADLKVVDCLQTAMRESAGSHLLAVETDVGFDPRFVMRALQAPHDVILLPYPVGIDWGALSREDPPETGTAMLQCTRYSAEPAVLPADGDEYVDALPGAGTACMFVRRGAQVDGDASRLWARDKPPVIDLKFNAVKSMRMAFVGCVGQRTVLR
jgi:hypothetical protein